MSADTKESERRPTPHLCNYLSINTIQKTTVGRRFRKRQSADGVFSNINLQF